MLATSPAAAGQVYSPDRFVRSSHYAGSATPAPDVQGGIAQLLSFQRAVSGGRVVGAVRIA